MNRKGFTLVELIAVIAIVAILTIAVVPNVLKQFTNTTIKAMEIQENQTLDSANLFVNDFCTHPVGLKKGECLKQEYDQATGNLVKQNVAKIEYSDGHEERYICTKTLQGKNTFNENYLDGIFYKTNIECVGFVLYSANDDNTAYKNGKTYLSCGGVDGYETNGIHTIKDSSNKELLEICSGL